MPRKTSQKTQEVSAPLIRQISEKRQLQNDHRQGKHAIDDHADFGCDFCERRPSRVARKLIRTKAFLAKQR